MPIPHLQVWTQPKPWGCNPLLEVMPIPHLQVWTQPESGAAILCWRSRLFLTFRFGPNLSQGLESSAGGHTYFSPTDLQVWTQPEPGAAILCWRSRLFLTFRYGPNLNQGLQSSAGGYAFPHLQVWTQPKPRGCNTLLEVTPIPHL